jgi:predicted choloylglycine hydrolase
MFDIVEINEKDSYSLGLRYGKITEMYLESIKNIVNHYLKTENATIDELNTKAMALWKEIINTYPEFIREAEGFCDATGMDKDLYLIYQMLPYLFSLNRIYPDDGCTAVIVKDAHNKSLTAFKNKDYLYRFEELQNPILYHEKKNSYVHISFGNIGWLGCDQGINAKGFVSMLTWCDTPDKGMGIQNHILNRILLKKVKSVDEAIKILTSQKRTGGCNFLLADKYGNAAVFENGKNNFAIRNFDKSNTLITTNHFMSERMMPFNPQISKEYIEQKFISSRLRYSRMMDILIRKKLPQMNIPTIIELLSDHKYGKHYNSICCHGEVIGTIASFIARPEKKDCYVNHGQPCENKPFKHIQLGES